MPKRNYGFKTRVSRGTDLEEPVDKKEPETVEILCPGEMADSDCFSNDKNTLDQD